MSRHEFKAYGSKGELVDHTWTSAPATYLAERAAYQARLDRCELLWVDISSSESREPAERLRGTAVRRRR